MRSVTLRALALTLLVVDAIGVDNVWAFPAVAPAEFVTRVVEIAPGDATSVHNNDVNFPLVDGESTTGYGVGFYTIGNGACGHQVSSGQPFEGYGQDSSQSSAILVVAGRHGTEAVAANFRVNIGAEQAMTDWSIEEHFTAQLPSKLNFWVGDTNFDNGCAFGLTIAGQLIVCPGIRLGQGSADTRNNWWLAGSICAGDGGTDALNCLCNNTAQNWEPVQVSFIGGSGASTFNVRAQCSDGYDCSCTSCAIAGYTYMCDKTFECHDTEISCNLGCSNVGNCVPTSTCVPPMTCNAAQAAVCGDGQVCCMNMLNSFCAPPGSVCCNYGTMTCPTNTTCDPPTNQCLAPPAPGTPPTEECQICHAVVKEIISDGSDDACDDACSLLGPFELLCSLAMKAGLCDYIMNEIGLGKGPTDVCNDVGACGAGQTCSCGYCTPSFFGAWCLALDAPCPSGSSSAAARVNPDDRDSLFKNLTRLADERRPETTVQWRRLSTMPAVLEAAHASGTNDTAAVLGPFAKWVVPVPVHVNRLEQLCVDGMCDASSAGCCLTCAP